MDIFWNKNSFCKLYRSSVTLSDWSFFSSVRNIDLFYQSNNEHYIYGTSRTDCCGPRRKMRHDGRGSLDTDMWCLADGKCFFVNVYRELWTSDSSLGKGIYKITILIVTIKGHWSKVAPFFWLLVCFSSLFVWGIHCNTVLFPLILIFFLLTSVNETAGCRSFQLIPTV